ncbi:hypothetical protein C1645_834143 [Glomus cerebriforme]|uniref:Uncharacterized protein n=1 Tax=Glomus cerebriforme TaxID=658196 RepID=A0A397SEB5_9GLOM|nr:hypothetical protein C1645_834143 [Glomus cerebriforme]
MFVEDIITEHNKLKRGKKYVMKKVEVREEDIENMDIINRIILKIDNIWGRFKNIKNSIENELLEKYYNRHNIIQKYKIERKENNNKVILKWYKRLAAINNEKIIIESGEARKLYSIMEKMDKIKMKIVRRRRWKIKNINYIERLLEITEKKNIYWSLIENIEKEKDKIKVENSIRRSEIIDVNEIEELIPVNRYSLYWNRKLVNDQIRETVKKYNKLKYLGEWLILNINENLITKLEEKEINWEKMIEYINNYKGGGMVMTSDKDRRDRSCNLKNLIEQLPTYKVMTKRNNEIYNEKCPRCKKEAV